MALLCCLANVVRGGNFPGSAAYWENRYANGGNSGAGSYNNLAAFKAEILNAFVRDNNIHSIIEFGCGDGNQLSLVNYPDYIGFDVSVTAVKMCESRFAHDKTKRFYLMDGYNGQTAELTLSLDVMYHLIEDAVFDDYLRRLFSASTKYVIIYACDFDGTKTASHVKTRKFTASIEENIADWELLRHIPNKYPYNARYPDETSWSDFYVYGKKTAE
ncbi:MAG: class I SAM-dependent methyltransferase [Acidobacteriota bacterium]|nr:class I SAM-dependent methyltransferase [Acidobacteriota bacterium]